MPVLVAAPIPGTYTVAAGDSLIRIGRVTGYAWRDIAAVNHIAGPSYVIHRGQLLLLPDYPYTVRPGDTLESIATATGATWQALVAFNELIKLGQVLRIPRR